MKASAIQIGNSKKERIEVDGEVALKSVAIGRWSHLVMGVYPEDHWSGNAGKAVMWSKHANAAAAHKSLTAISKGRNTKFSVIEIERVGA